jgi:hypothetical protein
MNDPYISIVIVGRNDDHGVDFLARMKSFIRSLDRQLADYRGLAELIVVEWNPLDDRPQFQEILPIPVNIDLRIITVPRDVHDTIGHPWPVLEFYAKNVGIRRTHGKYVLVTNPDIIFSDKMIYAMAQRQFEVDYFYRCDRYDFHGQGLHDQAVENYVDFAVRNVFQGHLSDNQIHLIDLNTTLDQFPVSDPKNIHTNGAGDFILASRDTFDKVGGMFESNTQFYHLDAITVIRLALNNVKQVTMLAPMCIFHQDHPRGRVDPWNAQLAVDLARQPVSEDWGLRDHQFEE